MKIFRAFLLALLVLLLGATFTASFAQTSGSGTDGDAANAQQWQLCNAWAPTRGYGPCFYVANPNPAAGGPAYGWACAGASSSSPDACWALNGPYDAAPTCTAGFIPPLGSQLLYSSSTGVESYQGCCTSLMLGGPNSGMQVETGASCSGSGTSAPATKASETSNADGSKTWCDQISGKCVTYNPNGNGPASSSSSNGSTDSTSQTNTPASSSSSTSTSSTSGTTSGSGSGGTGSGSYSGTTTTKTTTDNPASSSSTSTKCDTGVCDVGNADGNVGTLYTASTDTPSSVFASFRSQVSNSPIATATTGFFSVSASGACPVYTAPATAYWPAGLTFDYYCRQEFLPYFTLAGYVVLAAAAAYAFKIAVY